MFLEIKKHLNQLNLKRQGVLWVITPQVNDNKKLLVKEYWTAVDITKQF